MATNKRYGKRLPQWVRREDSPGVRIDSGPFIGYVKNNFDPLRSGRLQVWIPELGGDDTNPESWRTVGYASPYAGTTYREMADTGRNNSFDQVAHSYGMWAVPPDLDCQVICTFIAGDPNRGFWFACVNSDLSHYMMPGLASAPQVDTEFTTTKLKTQYNKDSSNWPVAEFNEYIDTNNSAGFIKNAKPVHEPQTAILIEQGLDRDRARGAVTSSSQRESPSTVFGISTPGRPVNDPANNPGFQARMLAGTLDISDIKVSSRVGGNTFIMDDGDQQGNSKLIRLRTAGGHQLLMNDSDNIIYIANSNGTAWVEFNSAGHISMFAQAGINMRTEGDFNIHSDQDINLNSVGSINMYAAKSIAQQTAKFTVKASSSITAQSSNVGLLSTGEMKVQGASGSFKASSDLVFSGGKIYLNSQSPAEVPAVPNLVVHSVSDTTVDSTGLWVSKDNVFESIATIVPSHEPWQRGTTAGTDITTETAPLSKISTTLTDQTTLSPTDLGPLSAKGQTVLHPAPLSYMTKDVAPHPAGISSPVATVPGMSAKQVKALMIQIGYAESGWGTATIIDYNKVDPVTKHIGGYQINGALLKKYGYVTDSTNLDSTLAWVGKDGIKSSADWLVNTGIQDKIMETILGADYTTIVNQRAIHPGDDISIAAGMLSAAYFFRDTEITPTSGGPAAQAKFWREQATQTNSAQQAGSIGYNWGRYAVTILAADPKLATTAVASGPSASGTDPKSVIDFGSGSGDPAHYAMLSAPMRTAFEKMATEFLAKAKRRIKLSSAVRTMAEQAAIRAAWERAGGTPSNPTVNVPGYGHLSMPAVPSSNSPHIKGIALDISRADVQELLRLGIMGQYSFSYPYGAKDPVHIQFNG